MSANTGEGGAAAIDKSDEQATEQVAVSANDFEQEIADYIASDAWIPDVYLATTPAATPVDGDNRIVIDHLWNQVISEGSTEMGSADFEATFASGFSSAKLAIRAANDFTSTKFTWSKKPPQSKVDLAVMGRISGEDQKYQRLVGQCATSGCKCKMVFRLSDGIDGGYAVYKVDPSYEFRHNHEVLVSDRCSEKVVGGYVMVDKMEQLTQPEKDDIMKHARAALTPPSVLRDILFKTYGRMYSDKLILNAVQYAKKVSTLMMDRDNSMNEFYAEMESVRQQGGKFKDSKRGDGTLKTVFIQTKSMLEFASKYHKVVVVDATFGTNKYGLKLVPYVGIDCLGRTQIMGIAFLPTENGSEIFEALGFFGLKNKGSTLITDDHSCYPRLAEEAGMHHLLCSYHFKEEILKGCSVLPADVRGRVAADLNAAIYESDKFTDADAVDCWFAELRAAHDHPKFNTFIERFKDKQHKILGFWTRQFYTANSYASQRIEALNYAIKGKGERKNALAKFNMFQTYERIKYTVANMEHKTVLELTSLASLEWAPFIDKIWRREKQKGRDFCIQTWNIQCRDRLAWLQPLMGICCTCNRCAACAFQSMSCISNRAEKIPTAATPWFQKLACLPCDVSLEACSLQNHFLLTSFYAFYLARFVCKHVRRGAVRQYEAIFC